MISLDGVMQAPGGPEEDTSGGFKYGGWVAPYGDEAAGKIMQRLMKPSDLLLGRKTFEIWEDYWPQHKQSWPGINDVSKYVLSTTRKTSDWKTHCFLLVLKKSNGLKIRTVRTSRFGEVLNLSNCC